MILNFILLQAQPQQGGGNMLLWMVIIIVVMWLLMIRPQQKQAKKEETFRKGLKKGDRVTFSGGIYGKVHDVGETTVEVEVANGVIMTVEKNFIQPVAEANTQSANTEKK